MEQNSSSTKGVPEQGQTPTSNRHHSQVTGERKATPDPGSHLVPQPARGPSLGASTDPVVIPSGLPGTQLYGVLRPHRSDPLKNGRSRRPTVASKTHHRSSGPETVPTAWSWMMLATTLVRAADYDSQNAAGFFPADGAARQPIRGGAIARTSPSSAPASLWMPWQWRKQEEKNCPDNQRHRLQGEGQRQGATEA